jgi:hypothetical protein
MKGVFKAMGIAAAALLATSFGYADDVASLRAQVADMKAQMASTAAQDCNTCDTGNDSLTSLSGRSQIQIGGQLNVDLVFAERSAPAGNVSTTRFAIPSDPLHASDSTLDFKINTKNAKQYAFISLDLGEFDANPTANRNLIDKAYFAFEDINCSNLDVIFGKADTHYGLDKYVGIMPGIQDGGLYVADGQYDGITTNTSATGTLLPTGATEVYMIGVAYQFDWGAVYWDLFQNSTAVGPNSNGDTEDSLFFESWNAAVEFTPTENLLIKASFQIKHDENANGTAGEEDEKSISLAVDYTTGDWNFWAEYQHGWDVAYVNNSDYDGISIGAMYNVNCDWSVYALGEVGTLDDFSGRLDEEYAQFQLGAIRTLDSGITLTFEWAHQDIDTDTATGTRNQDSDSLGMRIKYTF